MKTLALTVHMSEGAEDSSGAISRLLNIIALARLVNLRMELLLGACVAILAGVAALAVAGLTPLVAVLYVRARSRPAHNTHTLDLGHAVDLTTTHTRLGTQST